MANTARALPAIPSGERGPLPGVVSSEGKGEAEASGSFRVPELRLVPPEPEKDKVITELPATRGENETAKWVREQAKLAASKEKPATLPEFSERLGRLIQERRGLQEQLKKLDQPVHKALEALQGLGFLKDTLRTFGNWKEERGKIEATIESLDQTIGQLERDINGLAKIQTPEMVEQARQISEGSSLQDQALIAEWFQNPAAFAEDMDDEVEGMVKKGDFTGQEQAAWKKNELLSDTRQAIEERILKLKEENVGLESRRDTLERSIRESIPRGERKGEQFLVERLAFDKQVRSRFAGEGIRGLFRFGKKRESVFLTLEPELRKVEAQLSINYEAVRRAELALKDPKRAVEEEVVRELGRLVRDKTSSGPSRMPGAMSKAA